MMTSVFIFSGIGRAWMQHRQKQRRLRRAPIFTRRSRNIIKVFRKFGMGGIAFLTPVLLSPIGGTVIATLLGVPRQRILLHMFWSALLWGGALTFASMHFGHLLHRGHQLSIKPPFGVVPISRTPQTAQAPPIAASAP